MQVDKISIHCFVSGHVQGVGYRVATQKRAHALELTGWTRNLSDGRVEIIACGEKEKIRQFYAWLQEGPALAKVDTVSYEEVTGQVHEHFEVR